MTGPSRSLPAGSGGIPPRGNVETDAQRITREDYLKTIKVEVVSTLGSHTRGATLTVVGGAFKEDYGEEPSEVARNLGYASFEKLLQSAEFSDVVGWEITAGTGTGCGTGFCYKAKPTERIEHIMRDMEESEQSREEQERAEEAKKRAMLEHPQNDERVLQGKERILVVLDQLGAHEEATPLTDLQEEYHIKYDVVFGAEELKKFFGKASPKKVFLNFMHLEVEVLQDKNHGGQLYLKMKRTLQEFLAEYARIREEANKPKAPAPYRRKPFVAEGNFNGRQGQNLGSDAPEGYSNSAPRGLLNGANGSGYTPVGTADRDRRNGFQPNHFRKAENSEGFRPQLSSTDSGNGSDPVIGFGSRSTNNQNAKLGPALMPVRRPFANGTDSSNGLAQSTGTGIRSSDSQNAKQGLNSGPVQSRFTNGNSHPSSSDSLAGFNQTQHVADHKDVQVDIHIGQQPCNGRVRGFGVRKTTSAAIGARSPRPFGVDNDDAAAVRGFAVGRNNTTAIDTHDSTMPWSRKNGASGSIGVIASQEQELSGFGTRRCANGSSENANSANDRNGARGPGIDANRNANGQQHAAPQTAPPLNLMPVQALPSMNSSSLENSTNRAQKTVPLNLVPVPVVGLKNPYSSSSDEDDACAPAALPKPSVKGSTRKLQPNLVPVTANASQLSPASNVSSYKSADGNAAQQDLQNNRERNKAPAKNTKWTGRGNGVYTDVDDDSDDEDGDKEPVGGTTQPMEERQSARSQISKPHHSVANSASSGSIFNRKPQPGFIQEVPSPASHGAKWLELSAASARNNRSKSVGAPLSRNHYAANDTSGTNGQVGRRINGFPNSANAPARVQASNGFSPPQDPSRFRKTQKSAIPNDSDVTSATVPKEKEGTHAMLCFNIHYLLTLRGRISVSMLNGLLSVVCGREVSPATETGLNMSMEAYIRKFCSFAELIDDGAQDVTVAMKMDAPPELLRTMIRNVRDATAN